MATIKKDLTKANDIPRYYTHCDVVSEEGYNCFDCKKRKITEPWCDLKCVLINHVVNTKSLGLVCKDFVKRES